MQPDFFTRPLDPRFADFHARNPHVFQKFVALAEKHKDRGFRRVGAKFIWETIRYECGPDTNGDPFVLNNSFVSRYARLVAQERPDLAPLFELRRLRA